MVSSGTRGQLVIIGGAEDKEGDCKVLREFVRRAGGKLIGIQDAVTLLPLFLILRCHFMVSSS